MQNQEKQIEEMIETLKKCSCVYTDCEQECSQCSNEELYDEALNHIARTFYEAGYRKQSEGEWIKDSLVDDTAICSLCGYTDCRFDYDQAKFGSKYCPNCGAKMKGGAE